MELFIYVENPKTFGWKRLTTVGLGFFHRPLLEGKSDAKKCSVTFYQGDSTYIIWCKLPNKREKSQHLPPTSIQTILTMATETPNYGKIGERLLLNYIEATASQNPYKLAVHQLLTPEDGDSHEPKIVTLNYQQLVILINRLCWTLHQGGLTSQASVAYVSLRLLHMTFDAKVTPEQILGSE
jgi:hypothetical protein